MTFSRFFIPSRCPLPAIAAFAYCLSMPSHLENQKHKSMIEMWI
jgi:hypothetical protein